MKLVLLHSPLVGPGCWSALAPVLRARGHDVSAPDIAGLMQGLSPYYPRLAQAAAAAISEPSLLIVHSGAGALVPAVATLAPIEGAIFVDALLPHPGRTWFDTAPEALNARLHSLARNGMLPPWHRWWPEDALRALLPAPGMFEAFAAELNPLPLAYFEEIAPDFALRTPSAYLQIGPTNAAEADWALAAGWPVSRLALHHLAMLTHPAEVAAEIERLARAL